MPKIAENDKIKLTKTKIRVPRSKTLDKMAESSVKFC